MKKLLILFLSFLLFCFGLVAIASADSLDVEIACPASVKQGTVLMATVYLSNWDCSYSVPVQRYTTALIGNSGGTLGSAGIWGPYSRYLSSVKTVPAANCTTCTNPDGCPGTIPGFIVPIASAPTALQNTVAMGTVMFLTGQGKVQSGGECMISITP